MSVAQGAVERPREREVDEEPKVSTAGCAWVPVLARARVARRCIAPFARRASGRRNLGRSVAVVP